MIAIPNPVDLVRSLCAVALLLAGSAVHAATCDIGLPVPAAAYSTTTFASGFAFGAFGGCAGAAGMAFDAARNMYQVDEADGHLYKFPPGGGIAGAATRVTATAYPLSWCAQDLAFSANYQRLYLTRQFCGTSARCKTTRIIAIKSIAIYQQMMGEGGVVRAWCSAR
ncbi:MAG: hypothetical protein ABI831_04770 [Betaproteobacteria bacterium]